jgi:hypothetical protein
MDIKTKISVIQHIVIQTDDITKLILFLCQTVNKEAGEKDNVL